MCGYMCLRSNEVHEVHRRVQRGLCISFLIADR